MDAEDIVSSIGKGVGAALKTSQLFLGIERGQVENADIHPEYLTTVKVGEAFIGPDRIVSLETHMKSLRRDARWLARKRCVSAWRERWPKIERDLSPYEFGEKDSQRLDILVRSSEFDAPPFLMAEAKLGMHNLAGVSADIDRILKLLDMYDAAGLLHGAATYGAVVFHRLVDGGDAASLSTRSSKFLLAINALLATRQLTRPWLNYQANLLKRAQIAAPVSGYVESHADGGEEAVFAKDGFAFAPGLVLLGPMADVTSVIF